MREICKYNHKKWATFFDIDTFAVFIGDMINNVILIMTFFLSFFSFFAFYITKMPLILIIILSLAFFKTCKYSFAIPPLALITFFTISLCSNILPPTNDNTLCFMFSFVLYHDTANKTIKNRNKNSFVLSFFVVWLMRFVNGNTGRYQGS